ncbi:MAG: hypothetical protein J6Y03_04570 [Alphaproteobacteria bacterium]|nr:hypothetical protein [Alphaproteobacteria bacterium]
MKKALLLFFFLYVGISYNAVSGVLKKGDDMYYHSKVYCPFEKPIRRVKVGDNSSCYPFFLSVDDDYFHWNGEKICKIVSEQLKEQKEIQEKIKEKKNAYEEDIHSKDRVETMLSESEPSVCIFELSIHDHFVKSFFSHDGDCTEDELNQLKAENEKIKERNKEIEAWLLENYGKDCFSCDADVEFLTDKETCDVCPDREMKGDLCVLRKDKK